MRQAYVPISKIETGFSGEAKDLSSLELPLVWKMSLPESLDLDRILVNRRKLTAMHTLSHVIGSVVDSYEGEQSSYELTSADINFDGSTTLAKVAHKTKAELSKGDLIYDRNVRRFPADSVVSIAEHHLNKAEIISRVVDRKREDGVSREEAWAILLDKSLKSSFGAIARKNLFPSYYSNGALMETGYLAGVIGANFIVHQRPVSALETYASFEAISVVANGLLGRYLSGNNVLANKAWSLMFYSHPDRYLLFEMLRRSSLLIKVKQ